MSECLPFSFLATWGWGEARGRSALLEQVAKSRRRPSLEPRNWGGSEKSPFGEGKIGVAVRLPGRSGERVWNINVIPFPSLPLTLFSAFRWWSCSPSTNTSLACTWWK